MYCLIFNGSIVGDSFKCRFGSDDSSFAGNSLNVRDAIDVFELWVKFLMYGNWVGTNIGIIVVIP